VFSSLVYFTIIPLVIYSSAGLLKIYNKKYIKHVFLIFIIFESLFYFKHYFNNVGMDRIYKNYYDDIPRIVSESKSDNETVLVNDRIIGARNIFTYFNKDLENYEFRSFDIRKEHDFNTLYVDFLPGAPSPSEPLYNNPRFVDLVHEFTDTSSNEKIFIYRYQEYEK